MDRNRVTVRYAKALIELASEQKVLSDVDRDMRMLYAAINQYNGFANYINNPGTSSLDKFEKIKSIFSPYFHALSMKFFAMVFNNKREEYLKDLCRNSIDMAREQNNIVTANLKSAIQLDEKIVQQIIAKFEKRLNATLEMTNETDPELIGGFVFTIDGEQYDASIAAKLKTIKKQLQLK